jgi:GTP-binding protein
MSNIVAIVGRPNVGKSTLFNRMTESRKAIVDEQSGVTRDRHYGFCEWNGRKFSVVDVELGITDLDEAVADLLRKSGKPVLVVANKVDNNARIADTGIFYRFGLGDPFPVSSISGSGTGELLDEVVRSFKEDTVDETGGLPRLAIIGQPNTGKSSLLNALTGEERTIVTPLAGTTRDTIHQRFNKFGHDFLLVDTAGLRRKARVNEDVEFYSVLRSVRAIEDADVCLLLIDAEKGIQAQDLSIFHLVEKNKKGVVIVVNKWDLVEKETQTAKKMEDDIRGRIAPFTDVPVIFTSVTNKQRILKVLETALKVYEARQQRIPTSRLNKVLLPLIENYPPPAIKGKYIKIKYITQIPSSIPQFAFFCNLPQYIGESYRRFLENKMRETFDFSGVPISLFFRSKDKEND